MARTKTLANGQVAASATSILAGTAIESPNGDRLDITFCNTAATAETVVVTMQVAGGTARRVARAVLAQNEELRITGLAMQADDTLLAATTNASAVDYVVMGGSTAPFDKGTLDANGALKTASSSTPGLVAGFTVTDDTLGAFGTDSDFRLSYDTTDADAAALLLQMPAGGAVNVPVLAVGQSIESVDLGLYNGAVDPTVALFGIGARTTSCIFDFRKARGTIAAPTAVTTGDDLGMIRAFACVAAGEYVESVRVTLDSTGTIATTRGAGQFKVAVATDVAPSVLTQRFLITGSADITLTPATDTMLANGTGLIVGHTAQLTVAGVLPELQVLGTTTGVDGSMCLVTASTTNGDESQFIIGKVGNAALGSFTTVAQSENLGSITWVGDDGTDLATVAARIRAVVNAAGTVAASRVPTDLVFYTDPGGSDDAIREGMRLGLGAAAGGAVLFIGDGTTKAHPGMTGPGILINQVTNDTTAFVLQSTTDVATGLGSIVPGTAETGDYFSIQKFAATTGGAIVTAYGENAAVTTNMRIESYGGQAETTHTSSGRALMELAIHQHDGANALAAVAADGNAFGIRCNQGGTETTIWLIDEDGAPLSIVDHAAFADDLDDVSLIRSLDHARADAMGVKGLVRSKWDAFVRGSESMLVELGILGCAMPKTAADPKPLLNLKRLLQLACSAIWQQHEDYMELAAALPVDVQGKLPERIRAKLIAA